MIDRSSWSRWLPAGLGGTALALAFGLAAGSSGWGFVGADIVWQIRAPRVLAGFGSGAGLALAGALMQLLSRNALADPGVLGVSGGASVGALLALVAGPGWLPPALTALASMLGAAVGAALAALLLLGLSWRLLSRPGRGGGLADGSATLLLLGVMIGAAAAALVSLVLVLAPEAQLRSLVFWLLGDLNGAVLWQPAMAGALLALAVVLPGARQLDLMARGPAWAQTLGVPVARRRRITLAAAALATGAAVATGGAIGFVGLVVPHALRLVGVRAASALLPASLLGGGAFVVVVDALARTVAAPMQLPVGVLSAAIGVPVFVALLLRGRVR